MWTDWYWREPWWLLLAAYPWLLGAWHHWAQRRALDYYADPDLQPWVALAETAPRMRRGRRVAHYGFWLLLSLALAGPRTLQSLPEGAGPPAAMVVIVDLSASMAVRDVEPNRRAAALATIRVWLTDPLCPALGIVVFAGDGHLLLPPTRDKGALVWALTQLEQIRLPTHGNALDAALGIASAALPGGEDAQRIVILSDGDLGPAAANTATQALRDLAAAGVAVTMIGLGSPVPTPIPDGDGGWLQDRAGPGLSARNDTWMRATAAAGLFTYRVAVPGHTIPLADLWPEGTLRIPAATADAAQWHEWFPWPLSAALLLLGVTLWPKRRIGPALAVVAVAWLATPMDEAMANEAAAASALQAGDISGALHLYRGLSGYSGAFGEGVACYRLQDLDCALDAFARAAELALTPAERARAAFNLGNVFFLRGDYAQAAVLFADAQANGLDADAVAHNLHFARALDAAVQAQWVADQALRERLARPDRRLSAEQVDAEAVLRGLSPTQHPPVSATPPSHPASAANAALLARGLEHVRIMHDPAASIGSNNRWIEQTTAAPAATPALLWQRLFEIEAGFPGALATPRQRAGQRRW